MKLFGFEVNIAYYPIQRKRVSKRKRTGLAGPPRPPGEITVLISPAEKIKIICSRLR